MRKLFLTCFILGSVFLFDLFAQATPVASSTNFTSKTKTTSPNLADSLLFLDFIDDLASLYPKEFAATKTDFIDGKLDFNKRYSFGSSLNDSYVNFTLLMIATNNNKPDIVKYLIDNKADVNLKEAYRFVYGFAIEVDALSLAIKLNSGEIASLLIANKANVNQTFSETNFNLKNSKPTEGITQLMIALSTAEASIDMLKLLLAKKASVQEADNLSNATLGYSIIKLLLENGADISAKNNLGKTANAYTENAEVVALLNKYKKAK